MTKHFFIAILFFTGCVEEPVLSEPVLVGDILDNGIVAYVSNDHGFIVDTTDLGLLNWYEAQAATDSNDVWRLPRLGEMEIIYFQLHLANRGGFDSIGEYWSITEGSNSSAWYVDFQTNGSLGRTDKIAKQKAIAVKEF